MALCKNGKHDLDVVGVYVYPNKGGRSCRGCKTEAKRRENIRIAARRPPRPARVPTPAWHGPKVPLCPSRHCSFTRCPYCVNGIPHFTKGSPEHSARQREHQATRRGLTVEQMLARKAEREREEGRIDRARKRATKVGTTPRCMVRHLRAELRRGTCFYCGDRVGRGELDHVIPLSRGGSHSEGNTVLACRTCNQSKGNLFVTEWLLTPRKASRHLGLRNNGTPTACPFVALDALALLLRFVAQQDYVQERCLLRVVAA